MNIVPVLKRFVSPPLRPPRGSVSTFCVERVAPVSIIALILASTFYAWRFSYFWLDDFNNLYWTERVSGWQILWFNLNPLSTFFRPFGMLFYWIFWNTFDLNPLPYHLFAWGLHTANVALLYTLVLRIADSSYAAAVGALLFSFRSNFTEIYWSFSTIFELLACFLMLTALLVHTRETGSFLGSVAIVVLYIFAVKSKEMAVTLPGVLLLYDMTLRKSGFNRRSLILYSALALVGLTFAYLKVTSMVSPLPDHPYYMNFSVLTFGRGYGWYFDHLYGFRLRWGAWMITSVILCALFIYRRAWRALFFSGYVFVTFLPVIFLVNHRFEFFWYIPFFGIAGLAAVFAGSVERALRKRMPLRAAAATGLVLFAILGAVHYSREKRVSSANNQTQHFLADQYAAFIHSLRTLPPPAIEETIYYGSFPRFFEQLTLLSATQVALRRMDIQVEVVDTFPNSCRYCLRFENGTLKIN